MRASLLALGGALVLAAVTAGHGSAAFSGRSGMVVFDLDNDIYAVGANGAGLRPLTMTGDQDNSPTFSPDGRRIALVREDLVCVMKADGTNIRPVFIPGRYEHDSAPAWSPDGKTLAFVRSGPALGNTDQSGVWTIPVDGGAPKLVTRGVPGNQFEPAWSPDGKWIAFSIASGSLPSRIAKIGVNGTGLTLLTRGIFSDKMPDWSPDGSQLAFIRWHAGAPHAVDPSALWIVGSDGSGARRLTGPDWTSDAPAWSPDGTRIAFESSRKPAGSIFTIVVATGRVMRLVGQVADAGRISWQPLR